METASWQSGAAADTRVDEVEDEELDDDVEAPQLLVPPPGHPASDASMSTQAASSRGPLLMSTSGPGVCVFETPHLKSSVDQGHLRLCMTRCFALRASPLAGWDTTSQKSLCPQPCYWMAQQHCRPQPGNKVAAVAAVVADWCCYGVGGCHPF